MRDPRVAGFIEYLEEQAQKEAKEDFNLTKFEIEMISAYRKSDDKTKHLVEYALSIANNMQEKGD